ncbi:MAG: hypothetical protein EOO28_11810 [Comamonadaceae bacterium]|nr:MAG: hypothetical protein EOO28_11810 [Comamonadaceae bacterium]
MNLIEFNKLCRDAAAVSGIADIASLGLGDRVTVDEVVFESCFMEGQDAFILLADLGHIADEDRADVYEKLLTFQVARWRGMARLRFGLQPMRDMPVLAVTVTLGSQTDGAALAALMRSMAAQVVQWRQTLLAGKVSPRLPGGVAGPHGGLAEPAIAR